MKIKLTGHKKKILKNSNDVFLTEEEIQASKMHFFKKATLEVKLCLQSSQYQRIS